VGSKTAVLSPPNAHFRPHRRKCGVKNGRSGVKVGSFGRKNGSFEPKSGVKNGRKRQFFR